MKKVLLFATLAIALILVPFWGNQAFAYIYDDFTSSPIGTTIDSSKWVEGVVNSDILSVVDGTSIGQTHMLLFSGSGYSPDGNRTGIWTTQTFSGTFDAGINFFNYSSYTPVTTLPSNPAVALHIGTSFNPLPGGNGDFWQIGLATVYTLGNVIYCEEVVNGVVSNKMWVHYSATSGAVLLGYDPDTQTLNFWYTSSTDPSTWSTDTLLASFTGVTFPGDPMLEIGANTGPGSGLFSVNVGQLDVTSVPEPCTMLLLGLGLVGLAGVRRRFKQ